MNEKEKEMKEDVYELIGHTNNLNKLYLQLFFKDCPC